MSTLLEQFDTIFDTSESVSELKTLIIDLAVTGNLLTSYKTNESAQQILEKIILEREEFKKKGKYNFKRNNRIVNPDKLYGKLPDTWKWVQINDIVPYITDYQANGSFASLKENVKSLKDSGYAVLVRLKDLRMNMSKTAEFTYTDKAGYEFLKKSSLHGGEILVANVGAGVGTTLIMPEITIPSTIAPNMFIVHISRYVNKSYFLFFSRSSIYKSEMKLISRGTGQPKINKTEYRSICFPLPPLEEQEYIVEKLQILMDLCDELKARLEKKQRREDRLNVSAFSSLEQSLTPEELKENLQFVITNLSTCCTDRKHVQRLRNAILSIAIKGKLVSQDGNEAPASVLLTMIKEERERLILERKVRKEESSILITEDEIPYNIPESWEWTKLGNIIHLISGQHLTPNQYNSQSKGMPYLTGPSDFYDGKAYVTKWTEAPKVVVEKDDILITVKGSGVGKSILLNLPYAAIGRQLMAIRPLLVDKNYIELFIKLYKKEINDASIGIAIPGISRGDLLNLIIPLPPLNEQKRIIERVRQLMNLCDKLELQTKNKDIQKKYLFESMLQQMNL